MLKPVFLLMVLAALLTAQLVFAQAPTTPATPPVSQNTRVYTKHIYDPFAGLNFSYKVSFNHGQEIDSDLQGRTHLTGEYNWGGTVWPAGSSFALIDGHLTVVTDDRPGGVFLPRRNTTYLVNVDDSGKRTIVPNSLAGDTQITAQNPYLSGNSLWKSGVFKIVEGELAIVSGSFDSYVTRKEAGLDFTYHGTSDESGKATIDSASLHGQTVISGTYEVSDDVPTKGTYDVWTKGTFAIIGGQLVITNGSFERHAIDKPESSVVCRGSSDESGRADCPAPAVAPPVQK